jgi:hypothetical protein
MPLRYGLIGFVAVASRLVQGQFDIFWLAVQSSLPFLIAGLALGAHEYHRERPPHDGSDTDRPAPVEAAA